jgi:hypothetical protein
METECRSTNRLLTELILSLDPSVSEKTRLVTVQGIFPGDETAVLSETLKLLAVSIVPRRNALLSSRGLK